MPFVQSLKMKLLLSFVAVIVPLVLFMLVNNLYAKQVVREKVSETYRNTLDMFVKQTDNNLHEASEYLMKMAVLDSEVGLLSSYPYGTDNYVLTKVNIYNTLMRDVGFYDLLDTIFLYSENDVIIGTRSNDYEMMKKLLRDHVPDVIENDLHQPTMDYWQLANDERIPGSSMMIKTVHVTDNLYVGAIIRVQDVALNLGMQWSEGDIADSGLYLRRGNEIIRPLNGGEGPIQLEGTKMDGSLSYITQQGERSDDNYLVMYKGSQTADMAYAIMLPEKSMLQNLPFFQMAFYFLPIGIAILLLLYLIFVRRVMFKPLGELIVGMKKISLGMLDVRLKSDKTMEFVFLANTFNTMAEQIKSLKIGMYEEQLRVKHGELKQLQAQINPHFYMNTLNIIYNLAALKDHESVKKMSLHLADYFRFIMRANRDTITLDEELRHIDNYITIQEMRFPNKLAITYAIPEPLKSFPIPALTVQPFVENAIIHGFKNRKQLFVIHIAVEQEADLDSGFYLTIRDNGIGFPPEVLKLLNEKQPLAEGETSRLGIVNVTHRLSLHYGAGASIRYANGEEGGAAVTIMFPTMTGNAVAVG
ncbi:sensor histidine kinase [Paenibacillus sp. MMS18-CY102]|uniref:sensor histidine kinase n=1 Tax=Paenibacillus sp. MMS18-CY102 TaxID=2682849 RepID=UPI0013651AED|nr:histidine kinase [Paenibacillus sp. MMS18-CY102]MWC30994.1 HAMP domain-containing protein [Paenibacillus sp. MMS18-CY102]